MRNEFGEALLLCIALLWIFEIQAQNYSDKANSSFIEMLDSIYNDDFLLKNGKYYYPGYPRVKGDPFFISDKWTEGNLTLNNKLYVNIPLLYDIYNDKLSCIIYGPAKERIPITLNKDFITGFSVYNHRFVNSDKDPLLPQKGLYEILYEGEKLKVFARWRKEFLNIYTREFLGEFDIQKRNIMAILDQSIYQVRKNKDFVSLFSSNKKKVKSIMKKDHIKLKKSDNETLSDFFNKCDKLLIQSQP